MPSKQSNYYTGTVCYPRNALNTLLQDICTTDIVLDKKGQRTNSNREFEKIISGSSGKVIQNAIQRRKETRQDPSSEDPKWKKEDALLDLLEFITEEEHKLIFKPVDKTEFEILELISSGGSPSYVKVDPPAPYTGILYYPLKSLVNLALFILKNLEDEYFYRDPEEDPEDVFDIRHCVFALDPLLWKAAVQAINPDHWNADDLAYFDDPRNGEKSLFAVDRAHWVMDAAIKHRRETRGTPSPKDPHWGKEDALMDLLQFLKKPGHENILQPTEHVLVSNCDTDDEEMVAECRIWDVYVRDDDKEKSSDATCKYYDNRVEESLAHQVVESVSPDFEIPLT